MNNEGLTPRHYFTVYCRNLATGNRRGMTGRGNQGLGHGEGYINPPNGPNLNNDLEYCFSGLEPPSTGVPEYAVNTPLMEGK